MTTKARTLTKEQIVGLTDRQLLDWYRSLKKVRQSSPHVLGPPPLESEYANPKQIRWCYHEARRELTKRGLKTYVD
jgi:hypothetical protein